MAQKVSTGLCPGSPGSWAWSRGFRVFNSLLGNFIEQERGVNRMKQWGRRTIPSTLMKQSSLDVIGCFVLGGGPSTKKCYKLPLLLPNQNFTPQITHASCWAKKSWHGEQEVTSIGVRWDAARWYLCEVVFTHAEQLAAIPAGARIKWDKADSILCLGQADSWEQNPWWVLDLFHSVPDSAGRQGSQLPSRQWYIWAPSQ